MYILQVLFTCFENQIRLVTSLTIHTLSKLFGSPNLTPCNFYEVFFKYRVYVNCPKILQELKDEICEEIANKTPAMLELW